MKKFVIVSDSCCDLNRELREKYDVDYIFMHYNFDGKEYEADLDYRDFSIKEFYDLMRNGKRIKTAEVNSAQYREAFEKYIKDGYDILSISCSSALSHSVVESYTVRDELLKIYPESKIICIDSLNSCMGLGLLCIIASELRAEGKTIEQTAEWLEQNKLCINQECTVDSLKYLKQAGRVSASSAFFGGLLSVKPIIISDVKGNNAAIEKVKGRKTSIAKLVERFKDEYVDNEYQKVFVVHADSPDDGKLLKQEVEKALEGKNVEVVGGHIGPTIGGSAGPGTLAIYFYGKKVTFDSTQK